VCLDGSQAERHVEEEGYRIWELSSEAPDHTMRAGDATFHYAATLHGASGKHQPRLCAPEATRDRRPVLPLTRKTGKKWAEKV